MTKIIQGISGKHGIICNSWDTKRNVRYSMSDSPTRNIPAYYGNRNISDVVVIPD